MTKFYSFLLICVNVQNARVIAYQVSTDTFYYCVINGRFQ